MVNPVTMGRDKFEKMCKDLGFSVQMKKKFTQTTETGVIHFPNLAENFVLSDIDQFYSSDITYFKVGNLFNYITFILNCFSRKILGHNVSSLLFTETTSLPALKWQSNIC